MSYLFDGSRGATAAAKRLRLLYQRALGATLMASCIGVVAWNIVATAPVQAAQPAVAASSPITLQPELQDAVRSGSPVRVLAVVGASASLDALLNASGATLSQANIAASGARVLTLSLANAQGLNALAANPQVLAIESLQFLSTATAAQQAQAQALAEQLAQALGDLAPTLAQQRGISLTSSSGGPVATMQDAVFEPNAVTTYTLSVSKVGIGVGSISSAPGGIDCGDSCTSQSYSFPAGTRVILTPQSGAGSVFQSWSGACSGAGTCSLVMDGNKVTTATYYGDARLRLVPTTIAEMYVALFGRAPDSEGLAYWSGLRKNGSSLADIANAMFNVAPARAYYPAGLSNREIIASFYRNVLGREADLGGLNYWTGLLDQPGATPGSVIATMISNVALYGGTVPEGLQSMRLFNNRVAVAQGYAEQGGNIAGSQGVLKPVSADAQTVYIAKTAQGASCTGPNPKIIGIVSDGVPWGGVNVAAFDRNGAKVCTAITTPDGFYSCQPAPGISGPFAMLTDRDSITLSSMACGADASSASGTNAAVANITSLTSIAFTRMYSANGGANKPSVGDSSIKAIPSLLTEANFQSRMGEVYNALRSV